MPFGRRFRDRRHGGRELAALLADRLEDAGDVLVLGLARGGVPVAAEVADALGAPLDVWLVRKLGVPGHEELAFGAIAGAGVLVRNEDLVASLRLGDDVIDRVAAEEGAELERRERAYRGDRAPLDLAGRTVVLVDDGLATGASMRAAVTAARQANPQRIVVAVPVASPSAVADLEALADEVVCVSTPPDFMAVGSWYEDFAQTSDDEVRDLLAAAER